MSPSWHNRVRIGLTPDRVVVAAYRSGLSPVRVMAESVALPPSRTSAWNAAADALPSLIAGTGLRHPVVTVVLSNVFVRYAVLPWNAALKSEAAWSALARHRFSSVHGQPADDWVIKLSRPSFRGARVAAAVDRALMDRLEAAIRQAGGTFASAQPHLMAAFNRVRSSIGRESCWLVLEESGRFTLALLRDESWHAVRNRRADPAWPEALGEILERESALLGLDEPCTQVALCTEKSLAAAPLGLRVRDLTLPAGSTAGDRGLAMVLS